jgi:hypothetical protein
VLVPEFAAWPLANLGLSGTAVSGTLDASFAGWSLVLRIDLSRTYISSTIPPDFCASGTWTMLQVLSLSHTRVSGAIPDCANNWFSLSVLDVSNAFLNRTGVSVFLTRRPTQLYLMNNNISFHAEDCPASESFPNRSTSAAIVDLSGNPLNVDLHVALLCFVYFGRSGNLVKLR